MTARLGAFSWQWATVRKIKSYVSYRARTVLEPAGEWVPRPYPSPGHTSYCGTRLTRRTVAGHILEQPPRRWAHQARSLGPSLPSTSLDPLSRPQSRLPAASHPIHCPPRSPLPARLAPHSPAAPPPHSPAAASPGPPRTPFTGRPDPFPWPALSPPAARTPTQAPGIPPIAALASHGARLQATSSSNLRDVGPIKLAH
jgi:hypothetical protein